MLWKGASSTSLVTIAVQNILQEVLAKNNLPGAICTAVGGGGFIGDLMTNDKRVPLVSFTGSTQVW
jgi:aldehyde dehydrogenase family 7 protein A1